MNDQHQASSDCASEAARAPRREWISPRLTRLRAGEAEGGPNPATFEGAFAKGS